MSETGKRPHVILIMADQLRYDAFGAWTPNLNRLRAESTTFERAYCASPLCVPARGAFFTGSYPNENGCLINPWEPPDREHGVVRPGIPNLYGLMEQEWDSWHAGKQHLYYTLKLHETADSATHWSTDADYKQFLAKLGKKAPGGPAFKGLSPEMVSGKLTKAKRYSTPAIGRYEEELDYFFDGFIANSAMQALTERDTSKPLFLSTMFLAPHPPLHIPDPWFSSVKPGDFELPANVGRWDPHQSPLQLYNLTGVIGTRYSRADWEKIWPVYLGLVRLLDDCIGRMIAELKRQGIYDGSLIVFTSDHGEMLGSHCLWQKMCMYEESVRTPLWLKFPKGSAYGGLRESIATPVSAIDVLPTLCELLGIEKPATVSGKSLLRHLNGGSGTGESRPVFIQYDGNGALGNFQRCVVDGSDKLIVDLFKDEHYVEWYRLDEDQLESDNRLFTQEDTGRAQELWNLLMGHMERTGDHLQLDPNGLQTFKQQRVSNGE